MEKQTDVEIGIQRPDNGEQQSPQVLDWNGPNDPDNPRNWSTLKKLYHCSIPTSIAFLCPFGSSVYTPGHEQVMREFGVSQEVALLPFVFYLLGLSAGPICAGPSSETFGRKAVYLTALPGVAAFTLGAGFSQNITSLVACRFFAGLFASPGLSIGMGCVSDFLAPEKRGGPVAVFITMVQMGPVFGPIVGGYVTETESWRWTQWVILFGIAVAFVLTLFMSESYKGVILRQRAKRLGLHEDHGPKSSTLDKITYFLTKTISRPVTMMFTEPIVACFDIYNAFNFGLLNAFFAAFSWVFQNVYDFNIGATGLTYLGQAVGSIVGLFIILYVFFSYWKKESDLAKESHGKAYMAPEKRLIIAKIGGPMFPISLFWFAWSARPDVHWISPVIAEGFFSCGNLLIFTCTGLYFTDCYGAMYSASAWSSCTFLRYLAAFAFPLFVIQMYEALGVGWATSLLGFVSVLLVPVPFALSRYGEHLRSKSQYGSGE